MYSSEYDIHNEVKDGVLTFEAQGANVYFPDWLNKTSLKHPELDIIAITDNEEGWSGKFVASNGDSKWTEVEGYFWALEHFSVLADILQGGEIPSLKRIKKLIDSEDWEELPEVISNRDIEELEDDAQPDMLSSFLLLARLAAYHVALGEDTKGFSVEMQKAIGVIEAEPGLFSGIDGVEWYADFDERMGVLTTKAKMEKKLPSAKRHKMKI